MRVDCYKTDHLSWCHSALWRPAWTREDTSGPVVTSLPVSLTLTGLGQRFSVPHSAGVEDAALLVPWVGPGFQCAHPCLRHADLRGLSKGPALTVHGEGGTPMDTHL